VEPHPLAYTGRATQPGRESTPQSPDRSEDSISA